MSHRPTPKPGAAPHTTSTRGAPHWRSQAACLHEDGDLFFAADGERGHERALRVAAAKAVCRTCPVPAACLTDALHHHDTWAVRGGLDLATASPRSRRTEEAA